LEVDPISTQLALVKKHPIYHYQHQFGKNKAMYLCMNEIKMFRFFVIFQTLERPTGSLMAEYSSSVRETEIQFPVEFILKTYKVGNLSTQLGIQLENEIGGTRGCLVEQIS